MALDVGLESSDEAIDPHTPIESEESSPISSSSSSPPQIPTEIVSDEEMSLIEAAFSFAFAVRASNSLHIHRNSRSISSITLLSKRGFSGNPSSSSVGDIEDAIVIGSTQKKKKVNQSFLHLYRRKNGLFVTDITSTEWCEKQKEFFLLHGRPQATKAMKAGSARHAVLEEEVITRVEVPIRSAEERWALKMINFIHGTNQLFLDGLTRELPLIGFAEGVCVVGVIDEIQMTSITENKRLPTLVETKTRAQNNLPSEPQQRNAKLQLMCYKYLWDTLVTDPFPFGFFVKLFSLNPNYVLSKEIQESATQSGSPAQTLNDVLRRYQYVCSKLPQTHDELLLKYEYQKDESLIGEERFEYDYDWVNGEIRASLEFWKGEREARYVPEDERWKCNYCKYVSRCPLNTNPQKPSPTTKQT